MAGKLPCLQLFPPFECFFFFTGVKYYQLVTVTCRWMLPVLRSAFQAVQGDFQRRKGLSPDCWTLGRTFLDLAGGAAVLPVRPVCGAVLAVSGSALAVPAGWGQAGLNKRCLDVALSTTLSFSSVLCPCSSAQLPGSSQRSLAEQHGSASSISAIHWGSDSAPASLSAADRDGTDALPGGSGQAAANRTTGSGCVPLGSVLLPSGWRATECWKHWLQHYFCTDINQWGSKCTSHLHTFRLGGCVFGMGLTNILAALLINHTSALTEGFHFSLHVW